MVLNPPKTVSDLIEERTGGNDGGSGAGSSTKLSDGSEELRILQQQIALLQTKNELEKSLLQIRQQEQNAIIRIQETVQAGAQADLIALERRKAQLLQLEQIRQYGEEVLASSQSLLDSTRLQLKLMRVVVS